MNGKGSKLRKGANLQAYWDNYPYPEKLTVSQWMEKLGISAHEIDIGKYSDIKVGGKITEQEFNNRIVFLEPLTEKEIAEFKDDMNSMSFSEFNKFVK
jgi:hypothetical protein